MDDKVIAKGFVITPTIAGVLLAAFLGVLGYGYRSSTSDNRDTRDAIIRMEVTLNERTRNFDRQQDKIEADLKDERVTAQMYREDQNKKRLALVSSLKQQGIIINE